MSENTSRWGSQLQDQPKRNEYCYFNVSSKTVLYRSITENVLLKNVLVFLLEFINTQTNITFEDCGSTTILRNNRQKVKFRITQEHSQRNHDNKNGLL